MFQTPELNLEEEVYDLLFTDKDCSPISSPYIWRKFKRASDNRKINCLSCNKPDSLYVEGQKGCPYCSGYGYVYNDVIIKGYLYKQGITRDFGNLWMKTKTGTTDVSRYIFFTDSSVVLGLEDRILIPTLNEEGLISIPLHINETCKCTYSRYFKASKNRADFNVSLLGG
jgi:hypothetical protein